MVQLSFESMGVQSLESQFAFSSGSDLWIAPLANNSSHSGMIDWYINGQITKALGYQPASLSPILGDILRSHEIEVTSIPLKAPAPILIAVQGKLPARWLLLTDFTQPAKEWTRAITETAQGLNVRSIRLFVSPDFEFSDFDKSWGQVGRTMSLQIVRN